MDVRMYRDGRRVMFVINGVSYIGTDVGSFISFGVDQGTFAPIILNTLSYLCNGNIRHHPLFNGLGTWPTGRTSNQLAFIEGLLGTIQCPLLTEAELDRINKLNHV